MHHNTPAGMNIMSCKMHGIVSEKFMSLGIVDPDRIETLMAAHIT